MKRPWIFLSLGLMLLGIISLICWEHRSLPLKKVASTALFLKPLAKLPRSLPSSFFSPSSPTLSSVLALDQEASVFLSQWTQQKNNIFFDPESQSLAWLQEHPHGLEWMTSFLKDLSSLQQGPEETLSGAQKSEKVQHRINALDTLIALQSQTQSPSIQSKAKRALEELVLLAPPPRASSFAKKIFLIEKREAFEALLGADPSAARELLHQLPSERLRAYLAQAFAQGL